MPASYSAQQAALLAQLAAIAADDPDVGALPQSWVVLQTFATGGGQFPIVQGFYAQGTLPGGGGPAAALALGVPWQGFLNNYTGGAPTLMAAPSWLNATGSPQLDDVVVDTYNNARAQVWSNLSSAAGMPLFVTGMGLAGPVAQLAAADLRPGQTGPGGETAPSAAPVCYTFSTAAEGDAAWATFLGGAVSGAFTVSLASNVLTVDQFPSTGAGYAVAGTATPLPAPLAAWDDPWLERGIAAYLSALGSTASPSSPQAPSVSGAPAGFTQAQAYAMARLCAVAYQRAQHPGGLSTATGAWTVLGDVTANGVPFCTLFSSPDAVVAAFRGTVTWQEFAAFQANSLGVVVPYLNSSGGMIHGGVAAIAQSPVTAGSGTTFRQSLASQVQAVIGSRPLLLAGHDLGGALANLTATDLAVNWASLKPAAVFTFGAMPTGNYDYTTQFNAAFPSTSYQVLRPGDFAGGVNVGFQYQPVNTTVQLSGIPADDDPTQHALAGYIALLDPWASS